MKQIFTLIAACLLIAAASQNNAALAQGGGSKSMSGSSQPSVNPNPVQDYIKVYWQQYQCGNVKIDLYYAKGTLAKTLLNAQYCDGNYTQIFKVAGMMRGSYIIKIAIGTQIWSYKLLLQ